MLSHSAKRIKLKSFILQLFFILTGFWGFGVLGFWGQIFLGHSVTLSKSRLWKDYFQILDPHFVDNPSEKISIFFFWNTNFKKILWPKTHFFGKISKSAKTPIFGHFCIFWSKIQKFSNVPNRPFWPFL